MSPSKLISLKRKFDAADDRVCFSRCKKWLPTSAFPTKNGKRLKCCTSCREDKNKVNAKRDAQKHESRATAAASHSVLRSPFRSDSEVQAIAAAILSSAFFNDLTSTPASVLIFATGQVAIGSPVLVALRCIMDEGLMSFQSRGYYLPKVVTAFCKPVSQGLVKAAKPVLRVLFISDRIDHVSSGKFGVEAAILRKLFLANDRDGGRLINKNPDARNCNARPGHYGIVAALVFPQGIEAFGWHVQSEGTVHAHRVPVPSFMLPALPTSTVAASSFDHWLGGDNEGNEELLKRADHAYGR